MLWTLLTACLTAPTDTADSDVPHETGVLTACECGDPSPLPFTYTDTGGFDDWSGNAVAWAVDEPHRQVLVIAMAYELGTSQISLTAACEDPDALVGSWVATVPPSARGDVTRYPLLGAAVTSAAGVRSLPVPLGALLLTGDLSQTTPDTVRVLTAGGLSLERGDGADRVLGALTFGATADAVGGDATVTCDDAVRVAALEIPFSSGGSE